MPLKGEFRELGDYMRRLNKLPEATRQIAIRLAPKVSGFVDELLRAQVSPTGQPWPRTKTGAPAFGGGTSIGLVLSRLVGKASVKTTVLYPLHFHQDGTHLIGRKRGAKIRRKALGGLLSSLGFKTAAPRKRKNESEEAFAERMQKFVVHQQLRARAKRELRSGADAEVDKARAAGGYHDPPRPMIPGENDPIPRQWEREIRGIAREVMAEAGAEERP